MKKYVVGIIIDGERGLLIEKNRPDWQKGKLNGIGGKIEKDETPLDAIIRETIEECGLTIHRWKEIKRDICEENDVEIYYFSSYVSDCILDCYVSNTDEKVIMYHKSSIPENVLPDIGMMIREVFGDYEYERKIMHNKGSK